LIDSSIYYDGCFEPDIAHCIASVVKPGMMVFDIGANIPLTKKTFDFIFGYKYRTYAITVEGTAYKELHNTTYIGFQSGWQF